VEKILINKWIQFNEEQGYLSEYTLFSSSDEYYGYVDGMKSELGVDLDYDAVLIMDNGMYIATKIISYISGVL
jgi:hypothetical protein